MACLSSGARDTSTDRKRGGRVDTDRARTGAAAERPIFFTSGDAAGWRHVFKKSQHLHEAGRERDKKGGRGGEREEGKADPQSISLLR